jgi:hypothetical protein
MGRGVTKETAVDRFQGAASRPQLVLGDVCTYFVHQTGYRRVHARLVFSTPLDLFVCVVSSH